MLHSIGFKSTLLMCCCIFNVRLYAQSFKPEIYVNSTVDTVVTLTEKSEVFTVTADIDTAHRIRVYYIRKKWLVHSMLSKSNTLTASYAYTPETNDRIFVAILPLDPDTVLYFKNFYLINKYADDINKIKQDSIHACYSRIPEPYKYTFNVFVNDIKIDNYQVHFYKNVTTTKKSEVSYETVYTDSVDFKRTENEFFISNQYDSLGIIIEIGKSGAFYFYINDSNFKYGGELFFAVSTNDKKIYKKYTYDITGKTYSELITRPYLAIARNYLYGYNTWSKHSILLINCNQCNPTQINCGFSSSYYKLKDLK